MPTISSQDPYSIIADVNARLRVLESRYSIMRERIFIINQNLIDHYRKLSQDIKSINSDIKEIKNNLFSIKETSKNLIKEMGFFAKKENLKVLEKYINMWNPLNYVTEEEVLELIKKHKRK